MSTPFPFRPDDVIDSKYRVEQVLGAGAMGVVYAATHLTLGHVVAIKALLPKFQNDPVVRERFVREARAAAALRSKHVVKILDVGTAPNGTPYIVMERLIGSDLESVIEQRGALDERVAVDYVIQACVSLAEAHGSGIVHRDLKPANLFIARSGDGREMVKVLDFGISKSLLERKALTATADVMGTPHFMSPEQFKSAKNISARADIWALGAILYRLVSGAFPFDGDSFPQLCARIMFEAPVPLEQRRPMLSRELATIVQRCLEKDPSKRFANAGELGQALRLVSGSSRPTALEGALGNAATIQAATPLFAHAATHVATDAMRSTRPRSRRRHTVFGAAAIALLCLAGWTQRSSAMASPRHEPPVVTAMTTPLLAPEAPPTTTTTTATAKQAVKTVPSMPEPAKPKRSKTRR